MSKDSTINFKISHVHISGPYCILKENLVVWTMRDKDDENKEEMVPFFSYGVYTERPLNVFKLGDKVIIYSEPAGIHIRH
jgi:hypothetical protein